MRLFFTFCSLFFITGCISDIRDDNNGQNGNNSYSVTEAFPELSFTRPVDLQHADDGSNRLFVVEQEGIISVFDNNPSVSEKTTFLNIVDRVDDGHNEEGLLGLAFHPNYENNGYFYVNYTASNPGRTVIARYQVSSNNPDQADPESETEILTFEQPDGNHNGGQIAFGPDGYLYIAVGDGGASSDNGQNRSTLLGSILRIDVDNQENGKNYAIPDDNPYAGNSEGFQEEIYAYGMRNPWRFSFDAKDGTLWTADVGENAYEEIDIVESGGNYGWDTMEGNHCFEPESGCDRTELQLPVWEYGHDQGVSITGGFVYRGPTLTGLTGKYIYADYASGRIWSFDNSDPDNPKNNELIRVGFPISSFGVDHNNELYILGFDGKIHKLESTGS